MTRTEVIKDGAERLSIARSVRIYRVEGALDHTFEITYTDQHGIDLTEKTTDLVEVLKRVEDLLSSEQQQEASDILLGNWLEMFTYRSSSDGKGGA